MKYFYSYDLMLKPVPYTCSKLKIPFLNYFDFVLYRKKNHIRDACISDGAVV